MSGTPLNTANVKTADSLPSMVVDAIRAGIARERDRDRAVSV